MVVSEPTILFDEPLERIRTGFIRTQIQVLYAIMLHDIKSRFFGNGLGFAVTFLWPLGHVIVILVVNTGRAVPHGSSMILYAATAAVPFVTANYISRFMMLAIIQNKNFLGYPAIKPLDIILARFLLEIMNNFCITVTLLVSMTLIGIDVQPPNLVQAAYAWCAAVFLGTGIGLLSAVIAMRFPLWTIIYIPFLIVSWITCGIGIDPELLPAQYSYYISFNPVLHAVEWMRASYYTDFHPHLLDKPYLLIFSFVCAGAGLVYLSLFRGSLLESR